MNEFEITFVAIIGLVVIVYLLGTVSMFFTYRNKCKLIERLNMDDEVYDVAIKKLNSLLRELSETDRDSTDRDSTKTSLRMLIQEHCKYLKLAYPDRIFESGNIIHVMKN